ncbi:Holliday junction branch migration protein RuvA [Feifania hominis]|uniref:Holliday junction branch migration complex subunit RuvA n=1 Tax=Feifania hominis TaxID=2763660 RepID=A0A926DD58_9FIRM|nr:Holliday junction branch migration protein RuvA [Feifania hominis]MBC8535661.1 Holliday junction branch migration protein RuvA [Feifania hominis]
MFAYLRGTLAEKELGAVVVECGGVGFRLATTMNTIKKLPEAGAEVKLHTHFSVREDAMELFGFYSPDELSCFRMLISVSGVGPKAALSILSENSYEQLALAIVTGDTKALTRAPGIGPKIANRIVLELKDKIKNEQFMPSSANAAPGEVVMGEVSQIEAVNALMVLGYSQSEASRAVQAVYAEGEPVERTIKQALKFLMR